MKHINEKAWVRVNQSALRFASVIATVSLFAVLEVVSFTPAFAGAPCAQDGEHCNVPKIHVRANRYVIMKYLSTDDAKNRAYAVETQGHTSIPCHHSVQGDPVRGVKKRCELEFVTPIKSDGEHEWKLCGSDGDLCDAETQPQKLLKNNEVKAEVRRARYGVPGNPGKWIYGWVSGTFQCQFGDRGDGVPRFPTSWDPAPGVIKQCEIAMATTREITFVYCGAEKGDTDESGSMCALPKNGSALVRYGEGNNWTYRIAFGDKILCSHYTFQQDPSYGEDKECYVSSSTTPMFSKTPTGKWVRLPSCPTCGESKYSFTVGVDGTKSEEKTEEWGSSLAVAIGTETEILGQTASVETTAETHQSVAKTLGQSFTMSRGRASEFTCAKGVLWQWQTTVYEVCMNQLGCATTAESPYVECRAPDKGEPEPLIRWD